MNILWTTILNLDDSKIIENMEFSLVVWFYKDKFLMLLNDEEWRWWEFPWWKVEEWESPIECANRELFEETWIINNNLNYVWTFINKYKGSEIESKCHIFYYYIDWNFYCNNVLRVFSELPNNTSLPKNINKEVLENVKFVLN